MRWRAKLDMKTYIVFLLVSIFCLGCNNPCKDVDCQNGGTCIEGGCDCPTGFSGNNCQYDDALCDSVVCYNQGVCLNGICNCPEGYGGDFCEDELDIQYLRIDKVVLLSFPAQNGVNNWDGTDLYPDLNLSIFQGGNEVMVNNQIIDNAQPNFNYTFTSGFPFAIENNMLASSYSFRIVDKDGTQEQIVANVFVSFYSYLIGRPSSISISQAGVDLEFYLSYLY